MPRIYNGVGMLTEVVSTEVEDALVAVDRWLCDYVRRPHGELGRSGAVCPFVGPSQRAGSLEMRVRIVGPSPNSATVTGVLRLALHEFNQIPWLGDTPALRALLVVLPNVPDDRLHLLDRAHEVVKTEAVRHGMMIGRFHAKCPERAARNLDFLVSRSPVPLFALRPMALHDVLFLGDKREWFEAYFGRFSAHYRDGNDRIDHLIVERFERACNAYGLSR